MSFIIVPSKRFAKKLRKYQRGGRRKVLHALEETIPLLRVFDADSLLILYKEWKDHPLKGDLRGIRELHLDQDDLLLYRVDDDTSTIKLLNIVSHEELRKRAY